MLFTIKQYSLNNNKEWNNFLLNSKNATFLLNRDYMEYHSDRFVDFSLLIYDNKNILVALFPASIHDNEIRSHGGLTYGGFVTNHTMRTEKMINIVDSVIKYYKENNITKILYKAIPHIYHTIPSEEDLYVLFRTGFRLIRRDASSTINIRTTAIKGQKRNGAKKAHNLGMSLVETNDSSEIIKIINDNMKAKYNTTAVHTAEEMDFLKSKFKKNIIIHNLVQNDKIIGGSILYIDNNVIHAQYIATTYEAKRERGLDFIIVSTIDRYKDMHEWFDFGISTENNGQILNAALIKSKEEFNMSAICYDFYELEIK